MADDKELVKRDLAVILRLDAQIDYSQKTIVEKYYKDITQKELLKTTYGKKYLKRLEQIIDGDATCNKCLICNSQTQGNTMICAVCMEKLRKPSTVYCRNCGNKMKTGDMTCPVCGKARDEGYKYCAHCGKEVPMPSMETFTNNVKNKSMELAEQAAKITKENVQSMAKKGTKFAGDITVNTSAVKSDKKKEEKIGVKERNRNIIIGLIVLFITAAIVGTVGLDTIFAFFAFIALIVLVYRKIKKKPKRNVVIAVVVFLLLSGITSDLNGSEGVPDNVLDYIGTKESVVYKTYDKDDFYVEKETGLGLWIENESRNKSGFPHIQIKGGRVNYVILESGMNADSNAGGLHIGDDVSEIEVCMKKLKATKKEESIQEYNGQLFGYVKYSFRYKGKDMEINIGVAGGIDQISVELM